MSLEQILLYLLAAAAAIWGVVKILVPKMVEARLEDSRDRREFEQSTGNKILDVWLDQQREINEAHANEVDRLTATINRQTEKFTEASDKLTMQVDRLGRQVDGLAMAVRVLASEKSRD